MKLNSSAELTVSCNNTVLLETHMSKLSSQCHCREWQSTRPMLWSSTPAEEAVSELGEVISFLFC